MDVLTLTLHLSYARISVSLRHYLMTKTICTQDVLTMKSYSQGYHDSHNIIASGGLIGFLLNKSTLSS